MLQKTRCAMIQHDRIMIYGPDHGCCGTASPCGAGNVLRRRLLLQRQRGTIKSPVEEAG
jgi:hypothetical protein